MLRTLAVSGYRSLHELVVPLAPLTVVVGENGSGKSNLYRALALLAAAADGSLVSALAHQGGMPATFWAGPERRSSAVARGEVPLQGGPRRRVARIRLGFASDSFGYLVELGYPSPANSAFDLDPDIKRETIWHGDTARRAAVLVDRRGPLVQRRDGRSWRHVDDALGPRDSLFASAGDPTAVPEVHRLRHAIRGWRFYANLRTDPDAPARRHWPATRTPVLHHDGRDLAAALQTIIEIGDAETLHHTIDDAFPGSRLAIARPAPGRLTLALEQPGLLRALDVSEWSDGTLRYLLLAAALLTPRPPELMVLNEPETSLHPDLLPALGRLMLTASRRSQLWIVTHAPRLAHVLESDVATRTVTLEKSQGATGIAGLHDFDVPPWHWPTR